MSEQGGRGEGAGVRHTRRRPGQIERRRFGRDIEIVGDAGLGWCATAAARARVATGSTVP
ncbi:hypothetical protein EFP20_06925 [Burkholderia glumae]|nr:hypothetical protein NCPPB3923_13210 [Burkholderia glumae]PJO20144.1 hypothetical protein Y5A_026540 [Burkholderia glumae AU6208]PNL06395.1 hypothetical protein CEQ24_011405 [Burkholderia glumae]UVS92864.1 hypothetical protein EFP17_24640 [Burkholderia glumae]UVS98493.1 hypothetical protein EFP19_22630 [Burkholderia glumae]